MVAAGNIENPVGSMITLLPVEEATSLEAAGIVLLADGAGTEAEAPGSDREAVETAAADVGNGPLWRSNLRAQGQSCR